jgi:hypothetical protein
VLIYKLDIAAGAAVTISETDARSLMVVAPRTACWVRFFTPAGVPPIERADLHGVVAPIIDLD